MDKPALTLVPTPIGNLEDITFRAIRVLKEVDVILAEDTRKTSILCKHYSIATKLQSFHQFNEHKVTENLVARMTQGESMALVSDAGTPGISDPGFMLVRACLQNNLTVDALPGATAFVPALLKSGLPCDRFIFEGFLPHKKGRTKRLKILSEEERTIILYESPHRLIKLLDQLEEFFGEGRRVSVSREITKIYEEIVNGTVSEVLQKFAARKDVKGEIVVVIDGAN